MLLIDCLTRQDSVLYVSDMLLLLFLLFVRIITQEVSRVFLLIQDEMVRVEVDLARVQLITKFRINLSKISILAF